jgi:hypothetical protein
MSAAISHVISHAHTKLALPPNITSIEKRGRGQRMPSWRQEEKERPRLMGT